MKLATLRTKDRDGQLIVVSRDLTHAAIAAEIAPTLQSALENWAIVAPKLEKLQEKLEDGSADAFRLDIAKLAAPLPRAYAWIDSSVYHNHMELARQLRGAKPPVGYKEEPSFTAGISHTFWSASDPLLLPPGDVGLDLEGEVAVILDDVPASTRREDAAQHIRLFVLINDCGLRTVLADIVTRGFGYYQGKLLVTMSPVAVTPDELGQAWDGSKINLPVTVQINDHLLGRPNAGIDMHFDFPTIVSGASKRKNLPAGTVIGSGTISNRDRSAGSACIAEARMIETLESGKAQTEYLKPGDVVTIEMRDDRGKSIFGPIKQMVKMAEYDRADPVTYREM